ncbi:AP-2 complex subunit alpha-2 [Frankliniella fusca]|uniref:AP-2 complex subunit alpha-2 n=1 Tax=Frankliniella fusca TaxID=407009 RepID=A0AAE1LF12_9NEOP|nr:AP-2 complex subunit alpha-2 [Frankliniella fusca]
MYCPPNPSLRGDLCPCMACSVEDGASEPNGPARGLPWPAQSYHVKISRAPSWS